MSLVFPDSMPDIDTTGRDGRIVIELGPLEYVPYSVYIFLEVVRTFKSGAFHRMAGHVTQALVRLGSKFLEISFHLRHSSSIQSDSFCDIIHSDIDWK